MIYLSTKLLVMIIIVVLSILATGVMYLHNKSEDIEEKKDIAFSEVVGKNYIIESERLLKKYNGTEGEFYRYLISVSTDQLIVDKMYAVVLDEEFNVVASQQLTGENVKTEWLKAQSN